MGASLYSPARSAPDALTGIALDGIGKWLSFKGMFSAAFSYGGVHEGRHLAGYGLKANIFFMFQAVKNLSAHYTYLCSGLFCKFWGFWGIFGGRKFFSKEW